MAAHWGITLGANFADTNPMAPRGHRREIHPCETAWKTCPEKKRKKKSKTEPGKVTISLTNTAKLQSHTQIEQLHTTAQVGLVSVCLWAGKANF